MSKHAPAIEPARQEVLKWLREDYRNPSFLQSREETDTEARREIVERFLGWAQPMGFTLEPVNDGTEAEPQWTGHWRYRGNHLIGFKQPHYASRPEDATLLACAALLENEWCRARLVESARS